MPHSSAPHLLRGRQAEEAALDHLRRLGFKLVARNFRCRHGELDLVMEDKETLVFVEVRYRRSDKFGSAEESIDGRKRRRIVNAASYYLAANRLDRAVRFDVVAFASGSAGPRLTWIRDAFRP